ncbi:MAG: hypothetical protein PHC61_11505 [Chitinivibrionales bacterium]|nr:hypothetical protein [Chitinivibrionales bacterium]
MLNCIVKLYAHLIISLRGLSDGPAWRTILHAHVFFIPAIPLGLFCIGAYRGFKREIRSSGVKVFFEFLLAAGCVTCAVALYRKPHLAYIGAAFYLCLAFTMYNAGLRVGEYLYVHKNAPIVTYLFIFGVIAVVIFVLLSMNTPSMQFTKEGLKDTFRSITGSDPTSEEKGSFWKGNTGEENPNDQKKNEFWGGQEKNK